MNEYRLTNAVRLQMAANRLVKLLARSDDTNLQEVFELQKVTFIIRELLTAIDDELSALEAEYSEED